MVFCPADSDVEPETPMTIEALGVAAGTDIPTTSSVTSIADSDASPGPKETQTTQEILAPFPLLADVSHIHLNLVFLLLLAPSCCCWSLFWMYMLFYLLCNHYIFAHEVSDFFIIFILYPNYNVFQSFSLGKLNPFSKMSHHGIVAISVALQCVEFEVSAMHPVGLDTFGMELPLFSIKKLWSPNLQMSHHGIGIC